ncbi:MAG: DUF86 domain-containing protein [Chloroflexi bacterium]|nr:DUF86 domain-containing protein [Chloroflexota bacterium]
MMLRLKRSVKIYQTFRISVFIKTFEKSSRYFRLTEEHSTARFLRCAKSSLAHDYTNINLEEIWKILERDLPSLKKAVAAMQQDLEQDTGNS